MATTDSPEPTTTTTTTTRLLGDGNDGAQEIPVNMYEATDALVIVAPMPAVTADDVEISCADGMITLRAELRTQAPKDYLLHEWEYGLYGRTLPLPEAFGGAVSASLGRGQLAVRVERTPAGAAGPRPVVRMRPNEA